MTRNIDLNKAKGNLLAAVNNISQAYKLESADMIGIMAAVMNQLQDQAKLELLNELLGQMAEKDKLIEELKKSAD